MLPAKVAVNNLNKQGKLFDQGHQPVARVDRGKWRRACEMVEHGTDDDTNEFCVTFRYK